MSSHTVSCQWLREKIFLLHDRAAFPLVMTQPGGINGSDLLPLSLAGCLAWDLQSILAKQRQQLTGLTVTAESEQDDVPPWRFRRIRLTYRLSGPGLDEAAARRAVQLSETKYCSIYATLKDAVEITTSIVINHQLLDHADDQQNSES